MSKNALGADSNLRKFNSKIRTYILLKDIDKYSRALPFPCTERNCSETHSPHSCLLCPQWTLECSPHQWPASSDSLNAKLPSILHQLQLYDCTKLPKSITFWLPVLSFVHICSLLASSMDLTSGSLDIRKQVPQLEQKQEFCFHVDRCKKTQEDLLTL